MDITGDQRNFVILYEEWKKASLERDTLQILFNVKIRLQETTKFEFLR